MNSSLTIHSFSPIQQQIKIFSSQLHSQSESGLKILKKICQKIITRYAVKKQIVLEYFKQDLTNFNNQLLIYTQNVSTFFKKFAFSQLGGGLMIDIFTSVSKVLQFLESLLQKLFKQDTSSLYIQKLSGLCSNCSTIKEEAYIRQQYEEIFKSNNRNFIMLNKTVEAQTHQEIEQYCPQILDQQALQNRVLKLQIANENKKADISLCIEDIRKCSQQLFLSSILTDINKAKPVAINFKKQTFSMTKHFFDYLGKIQDKIHSLKVMLKHKVDIETQTDVKVPKASNQLVTKLKIQNDRLKVTVTDLNKKLNEQVMIKQSLTQEFKAQETKLRGELKMMGNTNENLRLESRNYLISLEASSFKIRCLQEQLEQLDHFNQINESNKEDKQVSNSQVIQEVQNQSLEQVTSRKQLPLQPYKIRNNKLSHVQHFSMIYGQSSKDTFRLLKESVKKITKQTQTIDEQNNLKIQKLSSIVHQKKGVNSIYTQTNNCNPILVNQTVHHQIVPSQKKNSFSFSKTNSLMKSALSTLKSGSSFKENTNKEIKAVKLIQNKRKFNELKHSTLSSHNLPKLPIQRQQQKQEQDQQRIVAEQYSLSVKQQQSQMRNSTSVAFDLHKQRDQLKQKKQNPKNKIRLSRKHSSTLFTNKQQCSLLMLPIKNTTAAVTPRQNKQSTNEKTSRQYHKQKTHVNMLTLEQIAFATTFYKALATLHLVNVTNYNLIKHLISKQSLLTNQIHFNAPTDQSIAEIFKAIILRHRQCESVGICPHLTAFLYKIKGLSHPN